MGSGMIDDFVGRKHGRTKVKYDHAVLEPILKDTYGVILYQEQVMRISMAMGGFTAGQADGLRKAMGKKIPEEIEKQRGRFVDGAKVKGIDKKLAEKVFDNIVKFGGYGFNKSHAAAYGLVSYRTAFLKANYPLQYMTAILNSEIGHSAIGKEEEESKIVTYMQDAEDMGFVIHPPDVQKSETRFSMEDANIRFGLLAVKNVGDGAADAIVAARADGGPFKSWEDFINRIDVKAANRKVLESLIKAGAFDRMSAAPHTTFRAELMAKLDRSLDWAGSQKQDAAVGQGQLFDATELSQTIEAPGPVTPWTEHEALAFEKEVLGFYLSGHPLAQHQHDLVAYSQYRLDRLPPAAEDTRTAPLVRLVGMIANARKMVTKEKKEPYARFKLEDLHGAIDAVVFPKSYQNGLAKYIVPNNIVVVKGKLSGREGGTELLVEEMKTLDEGRRRLRPNGGTIHLKLAAAGLEDDTIDRIKKLINATAGETPVVLDVDLPGQGEYTIETGLGVKYTAGFFREIEDLLGKDAWELRQG
jgi:DNA polymerase-3 subunit alpha